MRWKGLLDLHSCDVEVSSTLEDFFPGDTRTSILNRRCRRRLTISETSNLSRRMFKSKAAIQIELQRHMKTNRFLIHPCSEFRMYWEHLMALVYIISALVVPYYCAFVAFSEDERWQYRLVKICDICVISISFLDIMMNFYTGYVENEREVVMYHSKIVNRYIRTYFIFDVLSSLPIDHLAWAIGIMCESCRWVPELRYLKFVRIQTLKSYILRSCAECNWSQKNVEILWILQKCFLGIHLFACLYKTIGCLILRYTSEKSWLDDPYYKSLQPRQMYLHCLAKAAACFLCIGYGNIEANSVIEQIYVGFLAVLGSYSFIKCVAMVLKWETIENVCAANFEERLDQVDAFVHYKELSRDLHTKINDFYDYNYQKQMYDELEIMKTLSSNLRQHVLRQCYQNYVHNVNFLHNLPLPALHRVVAALRREVYLVNDVIINFGASSSSLYIIVSGTVAVYNRSGNEVCHLEDGAHFGEVALVANVTSASTVVAVEPSQLLRLERDDLWRALEPFPDLHERVQALLAQWVGRDAHSNCAGRSGGVRRVVGVTAQQRAARLRPRNQEAVNEGASTSAQALERDRVDVASASADTTAAERSMTL